MRFNVTGARFARKFEIWTKEDDEDANIVAHFFTCIGKKAYSLLKYLALPEKPVSLSYTILLLDYVHYTNSECRKGGRFWKMIHENIKNSTTLRHPNPLHAQGFAENSLSLDAVHEDGHNFGQCLSCGKFHSFNSYKFRNYKCFRCGDIGHIQSVCNTTVHLAETNVKSCDSDSIKFSIYNDHLFSPTVLKDSVQSYSSSELNMVFPNDSHISDEISCKSEENMLNEPSHDRKPDAALIDVDFSNDPSLCNDILNKFEETISEESNLDVIPNIICPHNEFVSCGKLVQCEARVLNDPDFDYNPDDFIPTAVHPYHKSTSNVYSNQCDKYVLNEATSCITWGYKYPALFRRGV
ncbi:unnamed protein product [Schistosoma curassoni]|uniref:CCHC-type domain-containing protein n=1 Tax=Schistosoma curassoni TaxID=6186 RepID=A0A183JYK8_9TREM|nr:unnamed protein product [Schistosoma curassoni]